LRREETPSHSPTRYKANHATRTGYLSPAALKHRQSARNCYTHTPTTYFCGRPRLARSGPMPTKET